MPGIDGETRRARTFLYVFGGLLVVLGFTLDYVITQVAPPLAGRICVGMGVLFLIAARFGLPRGLSG
ncbi:MAG: hypothetical protein ABIT36_05315 [Steroidobacteraceae bacterium]